MKEHESSGEQLGMAMLSEAYESRFLPESALTSNLHVFD